MLNKIKNLIAGRTQPQQPQARERNANGEPLFTDAEAAALGMARKAAGIQIHMGRACAENDPHFKLNQPRHVTPWIIGYMVGLMDYSTRLHEQRAHADFDVLKLFYSMTFAPELIGTVAATFQRVQDALRTGEDPEGEAAQYRAGAQAGFNTFPRAGRDTPIQALYHHLTGQSIDA